MPDRQITFAPHGHVLTNINVWSPDSRRIVYDVRSDATGAVFDGTRIQTVDVASGDVATLYQSRHGACCGVATFHPSLDRVIFILGPEHPDNAWSYGPSRRQGVYVDAANPGRAMPLDARDLTPPFTPGALRGGSHVHVFDPSVQLVSFTYDDEVLAGRPPPQLGDVARRNIGVAVVGRDVLVPRTHPRNHDGTAFCVLITHTVAGPKPGSDEYDRAYEEAWVGREGYLRSDGSSQRKALAFLGDVVDANGRPLTEIFVADLPEDLTAVGTGPLAGTSTRLPAPPAGVAVRRLTFSSDRKHPGVQGVRHWVRSSPNGARIATLMRDDRGISQLFLVSPADGRLRQLTSNAADVSSALSWNPDGRQIAHAMDGSLCVTDVDTGETRRLTAKPRLSDEEPLPLAAVFSPDGRSIAYQRRVRHESGERFNQIFVLTID